MSQLPNVNFNVFRQAYMMCFNDKTHTNRYPIDLPEHNFNKRPGEYLHLWEFLHELLKDEKYQHIIGWWDIAKGMFTILRTEEVAFLWGRHKQKPSMNFDKLSRALRYYYDRGIMLKVTDPIAPRHTFQFSQVLLNPKEAAAAGLTSERVKYAHLTPEEHAKNLRAIAAIAASVPPDPIDSAGQSSDSNKTEGQNPNSTISTDTVTVENSSPSQQELSSKIAMGNIELTDDALKIIGGSEELQKIYAECLTALSNSTSMEQIFNAWCQQAINQEQRLNIQHQSASKPTINSTPTMPDPVVPPIQQCTPKRRAINDGTTKNVKRPWPMTIPNSLELQKALGVPQTGQFNPVNKTCQNSVCQVNGRSCCVDKLQQNTVQPVLIPVPITEPDTTTTNSTDSVAHPKLELQKSFDDAPTTPIKDKKQQNAKSPADIGNEIAKLVSKETTLSESEKDFSPAKDYSKAKVFFKVHQILAGQSTLASDEKALFDAVNLVLINQVVRSVLIENDTSVD